MRIGIVTDSACDLPRAFLDENNVTILPISIRVGGQQFADDRDPEQTLDFYRGGDWTKNHDAESVPYTAEQIRETFLKRLVLDFDYVFCITITSTRSPIYTNATKASFAILRDYKGIREEAGVSGPFSLRVIDSKNLFVGQAVLVAEAVRKVSEGASIAHIRKHITDLIPNVYGYLVPEDLYYIRNRGRKKGDNSVGFVQYALGSALDIKPVLRGYNGSTEPVSKGRGFEATTQRLFKMAVKQIKIGLKAPTVAVSYGGDPDAVRNMPGYAELEETAEDHGVDLHLTYMSTTAGVNVGAGALGVGFAAAPHNFE